MTLLMRKLQMRINTSAVFHDLYDLTDLKKFFVLQRENYKKKM